MVEQSGLNLKPDRLLCIMGGLGFGVGLLAAALTQNGLVGLIGVPIGAAVPVGYVRFKGKQRRHKMLSQLPDAFDLMARAVRSGNTFWQAMLSASQEFEAPLSLELGYCHEMQNLGLPHEVALRDLANRTGLVEMRILAEAVTIQEQTGGNLAEILDKLTTMVRERFRIWGKVRTLTAEGQMQAVVLLALAPGMFALMLCVNYEYARLLIDWHSSVLLIGTLICEGLGWLWIRRIVNFDF
jgi:tight adherence protein B